MSEVHNRDILFRGKQVSDGEWIEGYVFPQCIDGGYAPLCITTEPICANDYSEILGDWAVVDSSTVGQYTGLTDKNGKKIFEGDIVKLANWGSNYFAKVEYDEGSFWVVNLDVQIPNYLGSISKKYIEVVGNIYDNFELLEAY